MMTCKYRDSLGKPGEGVHSLRLGGFAVVDVVATWVAAWALARWLNVGTWVVFIAMVLLGILVHRAFCVDTALNRMVFGPLDVKSSK